MVLAVLPLAFLAASYSTPLTANPLNSTEIGINEYSPVYLLGRELPECLKLGRYRTTSQIVWSCLATVFACTWVAIHPNLPGPHDSRFQRFWRRVTIAIVAIIAPEAIAVFATRQWGAAKKIKRQFNEEFNDGDDPEVSIFEAVRLWLTNPFCATRAWLTGPPKVEKKWTLTHGFLVQMGGFMMYRDGEPIQVLTFDRLLAAIRRREIDVPRVLEEEIIDKSKGDGLSKLVVVLQTMWFVTQCIGRWISHLPVTELEVSTLGFAVLNAYIYAFWWSKPQGVLVPIKLEFKAGPSPSDDSNPVIPDNPDPGRHSVSPFPTALRSSESPHTTELLPTSTTRLSDPESTALLIPRGDDQGEKSARPVIELDFDKGNSHWIRRKFNKMPDLSGSPLRQIWEILLYFSSRLGSVILYPFYVAGKPLGWVGSIKAYSSSGTVFEVGRSRVPMFYAEEGKSGVIFSFSLFILPVIFGGIHITLWSASFHTSLERLLWRTSAAYITVAPLLSFLALALGVSLEDLDMQIIRDTAMWPVLSIVFLYPVARCILIFISLYTLPHLPEGAYHEVPWANLLPHV